ncbi:hypothetical protein AAVH_21728 [Aphelenchoides avenae]|nr:hypothetical protein AAVH_21728 [Aphelenchus avenae]
MISSQYDRNLDLFFDAFENLERNESYAKSWLMEARHLKNQRVDYIEQLKAVIQDMSVILNRIMSVRLPRGRADEIRALLWRLGLLDSSYAYQVLAYKKEDMVAEYMNIAEFGYPFWGHVEEFLMQLLMRPIVGFQWVDDVLLPDAMAIRLYEACQASWGGACYAARLCFLLHRYFILSEFMGNPAMGKS